MTYTRNVGFAHVSLLADLKKEIEKGVEWRHQLSKELQDRIQKLTNTKKKKLVKIVDLLKCMCGTLGR